MSHASLLLVASSITAQELKQDKELLIIGTMHEVPSIVSHSYRPLLKYAIRYCPEAIFTEYIRPDDTLSMKNYTPQFLKLADSVSQVKVIDEQRFQNLRAKQLSDMDYSDFAAHMQTPVTALLQMSQFKIRVKRLNWDKHIYSSHRVLQNGLFVLIKEACNN